MSKRKDKPPFPPRFRPAFDMLCAGVPKQMIAKSTGYSLRSIYRHLANPAVKQLMVQIGRDAVAEAVPRAALKLTELMTQTDSKKVSLEATTHILGTAGIRPQPASAIGNVNVFVPPMPAQCVIDSNMTDQEALAIEQQWDDYTRAGGRSGYLVHLKDRGSQMRGRPRNITPPKAEVIEAEPEAPKRAPMSTDYPVGRLGRA